MKLTKFSLLAIGLITAGAMVSSCGSSGSGGKGNTGPTVAQLIQQGSDALAAKNPAGAKSAFLQVLKSDPNNCSANWGMTLADFQDAANVQLTELVANLITNLLTDTIGNTFTAVNIDLQDIPTRTAVIESQGCEFTLPALPIEIKPDLSTVSSLLGTVGGGSSSLSLPYIDIQMTFGTQWGPAEASVLGSTANMLNAAIASLSAQTLGVQCLIGQLTPLKAALTTFSSDKIGGLRGIGAAYYQCPSFLGFTSNGATLMTQAGADMADAMQEIQNLPAALAKDAGNPAKIIQYTDVNGDGVVDGGDTIKLGCTDPTTTTNCVTDVVGMVGGLGVTMNGSGIASDGTITIPANVSKKFMPAISALLSNMAGNLKTNSPAQIVPTDVNPLLESLGFTGDDFTSNVVALDPYYYFKTPKPINSFLPTLASNAGDQNQFQIEAEITATTGGMPWYYEAGDASHFTDGTNTNISPDGISVPVTAGPLSISLLGSLPAMIPYISFADPTFGGILSIDLSQMLEFCGSSPCPAATPAGFQSASVYSLDKLIAGGIYGLFTDTTNAGKPFTTENPIW
ncbi:MAG: hypothetical protein M1381_10770 [Deltaproteobacteria bacterium]|nr:hypothetical protein [Deltaproteobacteria bacterium]MCL5792375.1 hypothetical protein [Deltaproteobacteria bacterium]